jgi:hypothetical protein
MVYALRHARTRPVRSHTLGEHRPDYTPYYTYSTYFLLGSRFRYLRDPDGLMWRRAMLAASGHRHAALARLALGHGVFFSIEEDVPKSYPDARKAEFLERTLRNPFHLDAPDAEIDWGPSSSPPEMFERLFALGARLGRAAAGATLRRCLEALGRGASETAWLCEAALAHGLFADDATAPPPPEAFAAVAPLLRGR